MNNNQQRKACNVYLATDIATILDININYAYEIIKLRIFPVLKIGKTYKIPKKQFDDWFKNIESIDILIDRENKSMEVKKHQRSYS